jgi:hypothetical protein
MGQGKDIANYVKPFSSIDYYTKSDAGAIVHPYNTDFDSPLELCSSRSDSTDSSGTESDEFEMLSPSMRRPPGQPPECRIQNRAEENLRIKRQKCGRCGGVGHKKTTCKEPINTD